MLQITVRGPGHYNTNSNIFFFGFDLLFIKFLINTREKQELPEVVPKTSGLLVFDCPTECHIYIYIYIYNKYYIYFNILYRVYNRFKDSWIL